MRRSCHKITLPEARTLRASCFETRTADAAGALHSRAHDWLIALVPRTLRLDLNDLKCSLWQLGQDHSVRHGRRVHPPARCADLMRGTGKKN